MARKQRKYLGRYVVVDPEICHGKPTFLGTRIMVAQLLKQVAKGMPWDAIMTEWRGRITEDAIAEAVELPQRIFEEHAEEYDQALPTDRTLAKLQKIRIEAPADFAANLELYTHEEKNGGAAISDSGSPSLPKEAL